MRTCKISNSFIRTIWCYSGVLFAIGCGVVAGNPDDPVDEDKPVAAIPLIDFDIPDQVSEDSSLNLVASNTILHHWANRTDRAVFQVNKLIERLSRDKVVERGGFKNKGPDKNVSGYIEEYAEGPYAFQAVICVDDEPFQLIRYDADGDNILAIRDFSLSPFKADSKSDLIAEIVYTKSQINQLDLKLTGMPWRAVDADADGEYLTEFIRSTYSSGNYTFSGVNDYHPDEVRDASDLDGGDSYLVGKFNSDGTGSFVAYNRNKTKLCLDEFNELGGESPGWCLGRNIGEDRFSDEERDLAWEELRGTDIQTKSRLTQPELPLGLVCEKSSN